ncbi:hypothetical protein LX32DRAFT_698398 [Colletotrichum zoysiae]|uniref:Uncharacterized protein n=1 Tax=Colletotrichum zoysiae TaxID=1216348 RepID=A0AAD9LVL0_9PEZI|nr:hypothetical protein LX32DRAFT_698398 [Colletotrichum zoysiae]
MPRNDRNDKRILAQNILGAAFGGGGGGGGNRAARELLEDVFGDQRNRNRTSNKPKAENEIESDEMRAKRLRAKANREEAKLVSMRKRAEARFAFEEAKQGLLEYLGVLEEGEGKEALKKHLRGLRHWPEGLEILQPAAATNQAK